MNFFIQLLVQYYGTIPAQLKIYFHMVSTVWYIMSSTTYTIKYGTIHLTSRNFQQFFLSLAATPLQHNCFGDTAFVWNQFLIKFQKNIGIVRSQRDLTYLVSVFEEYCFFQHFRHTSTFSPLLSINTIAAQLLWCYCFCL